MTGLEPVTSCMASRMSGYPQGPTTCSHVYAVQGFQHRKREGFTEPCGVGLGSDLDRRRT